MNVEGSSDEDDGDKKPKALTKEELEELKAKKEAEKAESKGCRK